MWAKRLEIYAKASLLVLRPILIDCSRYSDHLATLSDWDAHRIPPAITKAIKGISHSPVWMVELSVPSFFLPIREKLARSFFVLRESQELREILVVSYLPACPATLRFVLGEQKPIRSSHSSRQECMGTFLFGLARDE